MKKSAVSKKLVIDTSVLVSMGRGRSVDPSAICCSKFLKAVKEICHKFVETEDIINELDRQRLEVINKQSCLTWLQEMKSLRKLIKGKGVRCNELRREIGSKFANDAENGRAVLKDIFLVEAAIKFDKIIFSCDDKARNHFNELSKNCRKIEKISWLNPCNNIDEIIVWLKSGCEENESYYLENVVSQ
jgi:hypothetical protein